MVQPVAPPEAPAVEAAAAPAASPEPDRFVAFPLSDAAVYLDGPTPVLLENLDEGDRQAAEAALEALRARREAEGVGEYRGIGEELPEAPQPGDFAPPPPSA